mmetsp:Transcript_921/g.1428  ORF Transcript_921/g.1428 Transcript_921/m.1428 type:complete len:243 (-) Transcript_921:265-993(-)
MEEYLPYDINTEKPELVEVNLLIFPQNKGSQVVKYLNQSFPLDSLCHLKRLRKHKCPGYLEGVIGSEALSSFPDLGQECPCGRFGVAQVPAVPPLTPQQTKQWSCIWPCIYKQPNILPYEHSPNELDHIYSNLSSLKKNECMLYLHTTGKSWRAKPGNGVLEHSTLKAIEKFPVEGDQYYCNGLWAMFMKEPCVMCGMALVHSRVERLYFVEKNPQGAFTYWKLHKQPLNYMYRLFQVTNFK